MKKFIVCLMMCLMIWTVIDKYVIGSNNGLFYTYILENKEGNRELYQTKRHNESIFIVGDKVKINVDKDGILGTERRLERVK